MTMKMDLIEVFYCQKLVEYASSGGLPLSEMGIKSLIYWTISGISTGFSQGQVDGIVNITTPIGMDFF